MYLKQADPIEPISRFGILHKSGGLAGGASNNQGSGGSGSSNVAGGDDDDDDKLKSRELDFNNPWVLYTAIAACVLLTLLALVAAYDLFCKFCNRKEQQITDGGPPATPSHHCTYTISIKVNEASLAFDTRQSVIRLELLDNANQYLTSLAVPCFVFKFKESERKFAMEQFQQTNNLAPINPQPIFAYKSMTALNESWSNTARNSNQISFCLIRRIPLDNLTSIRLSHDCYAPMAQITLKQIVVRNDSTQQTLKFNLNNAPIKALNACPPSGYQVFQAESFNATGIAQPEE